MVTSFSLEGVGITPMQMLLGKTSPIAENGLSNNASPSPTTAPATAPAIGGPGGRS